MKRLLIALLIAAMALTLMTACGTEENTATTEKSGATENTTNAPTEEPTDEPTDEPTEAPDDEPTDGMPEVLKDYELYAVETLEYAGWTFSGGRQNGEDMDELTANACLAACGGTFQIVFLDPGNMNIILGETVLEGTYELINDGAALKTSDFGGVEYYCIFTAVDGEPVLVASSTATPDAAIYLTLISEA